MTRGALRAALAALVVGGAVAAAPAGAGAATTIGSDLPSTVSGDAICISGSCDVAQKTLGPTNPFVAAAPSGGVITRWRLRSETGGQARQLKLLVVRPVGGLFFAAARSIATPYINDGEVHQFDTSLPIQAGDLLGVEYTSGNPLPFKIEGSTTHQSFASLPDSPPGVAGIGGAAEEFLVNADIEPDIDGDGAGDETADKCPSSATATTLAACPAPIVSGLLVSNKTFAVDRNGPAEVQASRKRAKKGTSFSYGLSEPGRVVFTIEKKAKAKGRKVSGKCVKRTRRNRKKPKCTRYTKVGSFAQQGVKGSNTKAFSGKIGSKSLKRGSYRAVLVATNISGKPSTAAKISFKVVRR